EGSKRAFVWSWQQIRDLGVAGPERRVGDMDPLDLFIKQLATNVLPSFAATQTQNVFQRAEEYEIALSNAVDTGGHAVPRRDLPAAHLIRSPAPAIARFIGRRFRRRDHLPQVFVAARGSTARILIGRRAVFVSDVDFTAEVPQFVWRRQKHLSI